MTVAGFLALTRAEQDAEVARWLGWKERATEGLWESPTGNIFTRCAPYVSGGWAEFGTMLDAIDGDIVIKRIGTDWLVGLSHWWTDAGTPLPTKQANPNLALALALGKALGTLTEK